jgi:predicted ATPase
MSRWPWARRRILRPGCRDLDPHTLKGIATPVPVYHVLGESGVQSRLDIGCPTGLTRLVGREQEIGLLLERWEQVKEGMGQVISLTGEAGIGKSRLVQVVKERVADEPQTRFECRCSPSYRNSALYAMIDLYRRALQFRREDSPDEKLGKLEGALAPISVSLPEVVPLLASLLSIPLPDRYPPLTLSPQRPQQKTLKALLAVLLALAVARPLLLIVEDLHWVDPSTLEFLSLLLDQGLTARIYTLLTFRPEFTPPWRFRAHLTHLMMSRLSHLQVEHMGEQVAGGKALPLEACQPLVTRTEGIPLFVEESTKMVLESG